MKDEGNQEDARDGDRHSGKSKLYVKRGDFPLRTSTHTADPICVGLTAAQFTERPPGSFVEERDTSIVWRFWTRPTDDCPDDR
jgi:hypothetical protein